MITSEELYYLNKALDGNEIYGIKPEMLADYNKDNVVKSLIDKEILNNDEKLNDFTYLILKNLEQYKAAKEYLWINDMPVSLDDSNYLLFFNKKEDEEFEFKKTTKELMLLAIVKEFEFLRAGEIFENNIEQVDLEKVEFDEALIKKLEEKSPNEIIYFRKVKDNEILEYIVYYSEGDSIYKYDATLNFRSRITSKKARREIATLLNIDLGENK